MIVFQKYIVTLREAPTSGFCWDGKKMTKIGIYEKFINVTVNIKWKNNQELNKTSHQKLAELLSFLRGLELSRLLK